MVRNYKRKKEGPSWSKETLSEAVEAVKSNKMSGYEAAKTYKIPRTTIMDHVTGRRGQKSLTLGRPTVLSPDTEKILAENLHTMEKWGFGLSREEVIELVADYIKLKNIPSPFKDGVPGSDWFTNFARRNGLSIKKPQAVEYARKKAADPFIIHNYFNLLEKTIKHLNLENRPDRIWNLDETFYCSDPKKTKVVGLKGFASTRTTSSSGKNNTTVLFASSAAGEKGPPFIIFKGKYLWSEWTSSEAFPGTTFTATKNGWIETEAFEQFMTKSFIPMIENKGEPTLLIYDGHSTHIRLSVIEKAKQNNITIIKLPPHSSHLLQPLDLSVFKPLKDDWDKRIVKWQRAHIGQNLPKKDFSVIVGQVWQNMDNQIIRNGFKKAGIYPFDRDVISENEFDPDALNRWKTYEQSATPNPEISTSKLLTLSSLCLQKINTLVVFQLPHPSQVHEPSPQLHKPCCSRSSFESLLLQKIKRVENELPKKKKVRVSENAEVLTHDNVLNILSQKEEEMKRKKPKSKIVTKKNKQIELNEDLQDETTITGSIPELCQKEEEMKRKKPKSKTVTKKSTQTELNKDLEDETNKIGPIPGSSGISENLENGQNSSKEKTNDSCSDVVHEKEQIDKESGIRNGQGKGKEKGKGKGQGKGKLLVKGKAQSKGNEQGKGQRKKENAKLKRVQSSSVDTTSDSMEMSIHDESDIENNTLSDILNDSNAAELDDFLGINESTREEEIEKIVQEIRNLEDTPIGELKQYRYSYGSNTYTQKIKQEKGIYKSKEEPAIKKQKYEESFPLTEIKKIPELIENTKKKVTILESVSINSAFKENFPKIKFDKKNLKVIDKNFNLAATQASVQNPIKNFDEKYNIGDTVLTRYYNRKIWKYYIGVVLEGKIEGKFKISFFKSVVKQGNDLTFVQPKRQDLDIVPADNIVKVIELLKISEDPVQYVLMDDRDGNYFNKKC